MNCVGSGLLNLIPSLNRFGLSAFPAWVASAVGAFAVVVAFVRIGEFCKLEDYAIQNVVAAPFSGKTFEVLRRSAFWAYWIFGIVGNGVIAMSLIRGLEYFFPFFATEYEITTYFIIFGVFYFFNRFGVDISRSINLLMSSLKILIMAIFPLCALFVLPSRIPIEGSLFDISFAAKAMFLTVWPFVGIESVLMERDVDKKTLVPAMFFGLLGCLAIYVVNMFVMMTNIPNLGECSSPYSELFKIVFPNSAFAPIFVNAAIVLMTSGSMYGWTYIAVVTCMSAKDIVPAALMKENRYGIPEIILMISSFVPCLLLAFVKKAMPGSNAFELIVDICVALLLCIYALGIVGFARTKWQSWQMFLEARSVARTVESGDVGMIYARSVNDAGAESGAISYNGVLGYGASLANRACSVSACPAGQCPFLWWLRSNAFDLVLLLVASAFVLLAFACSPLLLTAIGSMLFLVPMGYYAAVL